MDEIERLVYVLSGDKPSIDASYRDPDKAYFITYTDIMFNAIILNDYIESRWPRE
jgi:hypothetical protein